MAQQPLEVGQGLFIIEASRLHSDTLHTRWTPLDEWAARSRDLYLTAHNGHNRHTCMPPEGFEQTVPVSERPQTHTLDRAAACKYILIWNILHECIIYFELELS